MAKTPIGQDMIQREGLTLDEDARKSIRYELRLSVEQLIL